jgi:DMSO/TMAO reductase YedYZ molybdopterin-dependent catalytic subunit
LDHGARDGPGGHAAFDGKDGVLEMIARSIRESSLAALAGLAVHYAACYAKAVPPLTDRIAEWIMARTPNDLSVLILDSLGEWAKPAAATGGLAALGFVLFLLRVWDSALAPRIWRKALPAAVLVAALAAAVATGRTPDFLFWLVAVVALELLARRTPAAPPVPSPQRREFLATASRVVAPVLLSSGTAVVAVESWARERSLASKAVNPTPLWPFRYPEAREAFAPGLVRKAITSTESFYVMSKNTVDPAIDPREWRLRITIDGRLLREVTYQELLALPRIQRITTMRCVSNTLKSNLMGTAEWSGVFLRQLVDPQRLPGHLVEAAFIGTEGHDDSVPLAYAFSDDLLLALGMNGLTLNRMHGFPLRLLAPKYYGFKSVKWLGEIRFVSQPYFGTWPKMGYTKEPDVHTMSFFDRVRREEGRLLLGGVAFAGLRGIQRVEVRADNGPWTPVTLEEPLSRYTLTRWKGELFAASAQVLEARALDGAGQWQAVQERPLFPDGVSGPTVKKL